MAGILKTNAVQLGDSATDTQNFILKTNVDGTAKLARKSDGTGGDVFTIGSTDVITFTKQPVVPAASMIKANTDAGFGSTNTAIRRFTNISTVGTDITHVDSAADGAKFTINTTGVYAVSYTGAFTVGASDLGISVNSAQLTTTFSNITVGNKVAGSMIPSANYVTNTSATLSFTAGDIIRPHCSLSLTATNIPLFSITRVA